MGVISHDLRRSRPHFSTADPLASVEQEVADAAYAEEVVAKTNRINSVAALNAAAVGFFVLAALYELLHVDVEATIALFQYNDVMEASALATSIDLFLRLPTDALHNYEALVPTNPVFYKACTSGVAYTVGDFVSQVYQGRTLETLDLPRSARSGAAGFIGHGPLCHYWMNFMEANLDFGGAWWGTGVKVLADQTVWSLYLNAMYSGLIGLLAGRKPGDVWSDVKLTSWPALRTSWRFWPFVHAVSFSHAVPLDLKLLWVDVMEVVWVTLLSKVANDDKEAAQKAAGVPPVAPTVLETDDVANPATEITLMAAAEEALLAEAVCEAANAGELEVEELPAGCECDAETGLLVVETTETTPSSFLQEVVGSSWPLFAMWPFLYATYSLSVALGFE